jgi:hypothetical protein
MPYEQLTKMIAEFESLATRIGFAWPRKAPVAAQMQMVKEFLADVAASPEEAMDKWMAKDFLQWYRAIIAVEMLCDSALALQGFAPDLLKKQLELSSSTDLSQDFERSQSKEYLYELQIAAILHRSGFTVVFAEPDLRVSGNGLSAERGVACKYVSSEKKLNDNISKGYEQIAGQSLQGIVAIGMDNVAAAGMNKFIQFPEDPRLIRAGMANELGKWIEKTAKQRAGTVGRAPLDGAMFTLRMVGIAGNPKGLLPAMHVSFQFGATNPIRNDIERIASAFARAHAAPLD